MTTLNGATILVTGGTGSFGHTFIRRVFTLYKPKKVIVFSRDEEKQHRMRLEFNNPLLDFAVGDVRDRDRVLEVLRGVDYVFHAAALKQVPSCEFFPLEATKTNVIGTGNVLDACIANKVKRVVVLSTDKAVYPINAMGISKALMERVALSKARNSDTIISVTRYGNVMCSRGSVIPIWIAAAKKNSVITVTENSMTRFLLSLEDAINLVFYALNNAKGGEVFVKKAPASTMITLAYAIKKLFNSSSEIKSIGIRHGEKIHESLISAEEMVRTEDCGDFYKVNPDSRDLNYNQYFSSGQDILPTESYTSANTEQLDAVRTIEKLSGVTEVRDELEKR